MDRIAFTPGRADQDRGPLQSVARQLLDGAAAGGDEGRSEDKVLRRIPGDRELRKADEVCAFRARVLQPGEELGAISVEVADDAIDLQERESQSFSLTVVNLS